MIMISAQEARDILDSKVEIDLSTLDVLVRKELSKKVSQNYITFTEKLSPLLESQLIALGYTLKYLEEEKQGNEYCKLSW